MYGRPFSPELAGTLPYTSKQALGAFLFQCVLHPRMGLVCPPQWFRAGGIVLFCIASTTSSMLGITSTPAVRADRAMLNSPGLAAVRPPFPILSCLTLTLTLTLLFRERPGGEGGGGKRPDTWQAGGAEARPDLSAPRDLQASLCPACGPSKARPRQLPRMAGQPVSHRECGCRGRSMPARHLTL